MIRMRQCILIAFILKISLGIGQENSVNQQLWVDFYPHYQITETLEYYGDAGFRTTLNENQWSRIYIRPSIRYRPNPLYQFHTGVGAFYIFTNNDENRLELTPWQGVRINYPSGIKYYFTHRFRVEERFSYFNSNSNQSSFEVRLRYKIGFTYNLRDFNELENLYVTGYVEFFYPIIDEVNEFFRNTSRTGIGLGYQIQEKVKVELVFNRQRSRLSVDDDLNVSDYAYQIKVYWYWKKRDKQTIE